MKINVSIKKKSLSTGPDPPGNQIFLPSAGCLPGAKPRDPQPPFPIWFFFRPKFSENRQKKCKNMKPSVFVNSLKEPGPEIMTMLKGSKNYASSFMDFIFRLNDARIMPLPRFDLLYPEIKTRPRHIFSFRRPWGNPLAWTPSLFFSSVRKN